jgi:16S rRNA (guanine966-N2)-methyltransferase
VPRIIAGFAGSLQLKVPPSGATRPTSDRVREAVFSALDARGVLAGARVLDLYAGTGALGLEAASRGAAEVVLVDRQNAATRVGTENARRVERSAPRGAALSVRVTAQPVQAFLGGATGGWTLVFLDPPYELGAAELAHNLEALVPLLAADAVVVLERSSRDPEPAWPDGLELERRRDYGDTAVYWLTADEPEDRPVDRPAQGPASAAQPASPDQSA